MAWIRNLFAIQKITNVNINLYFLQKRRDVGYEVNRLPWWLDGKTSACNAGDPRSILRLGKSPGEGIGSPLQYSCLKNGQRSLAGYSPWGHRVRHDWAANTTAWSKDDMRQRTQIFFFTFAFGQFNGYLLIFDHRDSISFPHISIFFWEITHFLLNVFWLHC